MGRRQSSSCSTSIRCSSSESTRRLCLSIWRARLLRASRGPHSWLGDAVATGQADALFRSRYRPYGLFAFARPRRCASRDPPGSQAGWAARRFRWRLQHYYRRPVRRRSAAACCPDRSTWTGRRDHTLFGLAAQTGLRASELIGLRCADVHLAAGAYVSCQGKGRKQRITPLTSGLVTTLRVWLAERAGLPGAPLFVTRSGKALSRDALEHRLAKYVQMAGGVCPTLMQKSVTMHVLRHSAAMRLLHAGIDTSVIALWLGHENVETTQVYLHGDVCAKGPLNPARAVSW